MIANPAAGLPRLLAGVVCYGREQERQGRSMAGERRGTPTSMNFCRSSALVRCRNFTATSCTPARTALYTCAPPHTYGSDRLQCILQHAVQPSACRLQQLTARSACSAALPDAPPNVQGSAWVQPALLPQDDRGQCVTSTPIWRLEH